MNFIASAQEYQTAFAKVEATQEATQFVNVLGPCPVNLGYGKSTRRLHRYVAPSPG